MKLYSRKYHRYVERKVHFAVGLSVKTACGLVLFSRHVMVSVFSDNDGTMITDDLERVTCKRCLATKETRIRKLIEIEKSLPGIFDHDRLCGEQWLFDHALAISEEDIDSQKFEFSVGERTISLSNKTTAKDRKEIIRNFIGKT